MMLQESRVKVSAAMFVADDVRWGLGVGDWGPAGVILRNFIHDIAK
jgi:hypothetical protein